MARRTYYNSKSNGPFGSIMSLLMVFVFFAALFYVASFVFKLLWWIAPVLMLITLVMDHKIVTGYIEWVWNKLKVNPIMGVAFVLLTFFGFPVVAGYLFGKLMLRRKITKMTESMQQRGKGPFASEEDYVDYEEVESEPVTRIEIPKADLPPKVKQKPENNKYDDFFE